MSTETWNRYLRKDYPTVDNPVRTWITATALWSRFRAHSGYCAAVLMQQARPENIIQPERQMFLFFLGGNYCMWSSRPMDVSDPPENRNRNFMHVRLETNRNIPKKSNRFASQHLAR